CTFWLGQLFTHSQFQPKQEALRLNDFLIVNCKSRLVLSETAFVFINIYALSLSHEHETRHIFNTTISFHCRIRLRPDGSATALRQNQTGHKEAEHIRRCPLLRCASGRRKHSPYCVASQRKTFPHGLSFVNAGRRGPEPYRHRASRRAWP